jgi:hypothetical protein
MESPLEVLSRAATMVQSGVTSKYNILSLSVVKLFVFNLGDLAILQFKIIFLVIMNNIYQDFPSTSLYF